MNDERRQLIEELAIKAHRACERQKVLALQNVASDPEEREKQAINYALATAEMFEAMHALNVATARPPSRESHIS